MINMSSTNFGCPICKKKFKSKEDLNYHEMYHSDEERRKLEEKNNKKTMPVRGSQALLQAKWAGGEVMALGPGRGNKRSLDSDNSTDANDANGYAVPAKVAKTDSSRGYYTTPSSSTPGAGASGYYTSKTNNSASHSTRSSDCAGIIERVRLENFMCHSNLVWEPNQCVNFVTGKNGSGKSSVLQGLVLGLCGESKSTKRFSKVSEFIKKDTNKATIQVTLRNTGEDAYKPDIFGESVTFQRTITESGSSSYSLKDHNGKDTGKKSKEAKDECKRILDQFQIQVESPIVVLQQDEAKEMLKIESPDKLYDFFVKATLIKQCIDQYSAAQVEYNKAYDTLEVKKQRLRELNDEYKKKQHKYDEIKRNEQADAELLECKGQYAWARVHAARDNSERVMVNIQKLTKRIEQPKAKLISLHETLSDLKMRQSELEMMIEEEQSKFGEQEQELLDLKDEIDKCKKELKKIAQDLKAENTNKNSICQEMRVLNDQLEEIQAGEQRGDKEVRAQQRKIMLINLEKQKKDIEDKINAEGSTRELVDVKVRQEHEREVQIDAEMNYKKERQVGLRREISEMEGQSEQHLAVFGAKIPHVDRRIKASLHDFRVAPIGPVGQYVKLKGEAGSNQELSKLIETELSRTQVTAYLCNDDQDRRILTRILDEVYGSDRAKPKIFTSRFIYQPHNVIRPVCREPVLMDYLQIENPVVFNHLVDQKSIESVIVCRLQDTAKALMTRRECVPRNVSYAITHDFYRFFPPKESSSYRSYWMERLPGSGMLRCTITNFIAERQEELEDIDSQLNQLVVEKNVVARNKKSNEAEKKRVVVEIQQLRNKVANLNSQVSQVKAEEEASPDEAINIRARLMTRQTELDATEDKVAEWVNEKEALGGLIKEKEELFRTNKKELTVLKSSTNPVLKDLRELETQIRNKRKEILNQEKLVKELNNGLEGSRAEHKKIREEEKNFEGAAKKITGTEMVPEKSVKWLNAKIQQLQKKINKQNEDVEDVQEFINEFIKTKERFQHMKQQIDTITSLLTGIDELNSERKNNFYVIRSTVSHYVRRHFNFLMQGFSKQTGSSVFLRLDNNNKELHFTFKNLDGTKTRNNADVSTLSGGEKSFTQMCLICSLWQMMKPPFRCLDEWDVFLDAINRKAISEELLKFSLQNQDKQFIFISPQGACDVSNVQRGMVTVTEIKKS